MMAGFVKATKQQAKLRIAFTGSSGSGKTFTALRVASVIAAAAGKRVAVIDTEHGSAAKYADLFDFDTMELTSFDPRNYVAGIKAAEEAGYAVLVVDSLSHAWSGVGGALEMVDKAAARSQSHNSFAAWREVTPVQNQLIETILGSGLHIIATMRVKTEYIIETQNGKQTPRKVGLAPVQRDQVEYEFDVVGDLDQSHTLIITKTRCPALDEAVVKQPGEDFARTLLAWIGQGEAPKSEAARPATAVAESEATSASTPTTPKQGDPPCDAEHFNKTWHGTVAGTALASDEKRHEYVLAFTKKQFEDDPRRWVESLTQFLRGDADHDCPPASESEANALIAAVSKSIQQRRTAEQAERVDDKTRPAAKSKARLTVEENYATLMKAATDLGVDLAGFEVDATVSDDELNAQLAKLASAVRIANERPRERVAP